MTSFYDGIRYVNLLRSETWPNGVPETADLKQKMTEMGDAVMDTLLVPKLQDDGYLISIADDEDSMFSDDGTEDYVGELERQLHTLRTEYSEYRDAVQQQFLQRFESETINKPVKKEEGEKNLDYYFESYSTAEIHEDMLKDRVRTEAYRDFIYQNKHLFENKVVLDVGCGTGILSMFCAKAGAKKVYAVDFSRMAEKARLIVHENGLDGVIEVLQIKVEDLAKVVGENLKVDVIVSEWMGYALIYESMFDSVICARDKFLREGGLMVPSQATIHMAALEDDRWMNDRLDFWNDVYGFKMSCMKSFVRDGVAVDTVTKGSLISEAATIKTMACHRITVPEMDFTSDFEMGIERDGQVYSFGIWFDIAFDGPEGDQRTERVTFSTSPESTPTHWKQSILVLKEPLHVLKGDFIAGSISMFKNTANERSIDMHVSYQVKKADGSTNPEHHLTLHLG